MARCWTHGVLGLFGMVLASELKMFTPSCDVGHFFSALSISYVPATLLWFQFSNAALLSRNRNTVPVAYSIVIAWYLRIDFQQLMTSLQYHWMQRSLRDIAALYGCEASLEKVEEFRKAQGLSSIGSKCFQAANVSAILVDDGLALDKMLELEAHKEFVPTVSRVLRIEWLAETIINDVSLPLSSQR